MRLALLGATFLVTASAFSSADAADVYARGGSLKDGPVDYRPAISWAGFYVGVHAGATFGDSAELTFDDHKIDSIDIDNAFTGGIHVGYNWQGVPNWVFGIEGSLDLVNDDIEDHDITDFLASVRGRIGYALDRTLVYGTGGVAFLGYSDDAVEGFGLDDDLAVGFVVGAGIEHKLRDNVSLGVEGLYYNFSSDSIEPAFEVDRDFWSVQARLSYHFADRYAEPLK